VAGKIYEAIHYAVLSKFPTISSYKILRPYQHHHHSQTQSTVYSQCHRPSVTPTSITIPHKHTHSLYFNSHVFRKQEVQQNILKLQSALLQINSSQFLQSAISIP